MKRITISLDEETHRLAKLKAAEKGTSVSAMVRGYLNGLVREESMADNSIAPGLEKPGKTLDEVIEAIFARGGGIDPRENLTREELYDRNAFR